VASGTGSRIRFPVRDEVGYVKKQKEWVRAFRVNAAVLSSSRYLPTALGSVSVCSRRDKITCTTTIVLVLTDFGEG